MSDIFTAFTCDLVTPYGSGHRGAPALLLDFALNWWQNQVIRQPHLHDPTHMVSQNLVNIGSSNGLLPDDTKPLADPMLTSHKCSTAPFT